MSALTRYQQFIDNTWVDAVSSATYDTDNPYTGEPWATVPRSSADDVDRAVRAASDALTGPWGRMTGFEKAELMRRLADPDRP